jgi:hypothetical protein
MQSSALPCSLVPLKYKYIFLSTLFSYISLYCVVLNIMTIFIHNIYNFALLMEG